MTDLSVARLIDAAVLSFRQNVLPAISTEEARIHADLITRVLWHASFHLSGIADAKQNLLQDQKQLLDEIDVFAGRQISSFSEMSQQDDLTSIEQRLKTAVPVLLQAASGLTAYSLLERMINNERAFLSAQDADITGGSMAVFRGGRIETERGQFKTKTDPAIFAGKINIYFNQNDPAVSIQNVRFVPGGFSKSTIFFDRIKDAVTEPLVIRQDMCLPFMDKTVIDEFPILRQLYAAGFPVAEPILLEKDRKFLGSPFIVSRRVSGTCDFQSWASDPVSVTRFSQELASIMASLHNLDLNELGFEVANAKSAGECMKEELERWTKFFAAKRRRPHILLDIALNWLNANIPAESFNRPTRIVHGDIGFHNLLFKDDQVTALLDWEFSHFGDPFEDLVYTKMFIEQIMDWDIFKSFYQSRVGLDCPAETEIFFGIWARVRNAIGCIDAANLFDTSLPDEIKFAVSGHVLGDYVELEAAELLMAHLKNSLKK